MLISTHELALVEKHLDQVMMLKDGRLTAGPATLEALRQQAQNITVFLTNGFQMRGIVRGFDSFVVILESDGKQQMIYKHAISTLIPQHRVDLHAPRGERAEQ